MFSTDSKILDIVSDFPEAEEVFRSYDELAGKCVLCHHLFETLGDFSSLYSLDLDVLISQLQASVE